MDRKSAIKLVYKCDVDEDKYEYWIPSDGIGPRAFGESEWFAGVSWHRCETKERCAHAVHRWVKHQKRCWFLPTGCGTFSSPRVERSSTPPNTNWIEVTESYAKYLSTKPEGECELRIVKEGDEYLNFSGKWIKSGIDFAGYISTCDDLNYRWVKTESLKIVPVVDGKCKGYMLILGSCANDKGDEIQAQYIYDNGQESPHSWLWKDPTNPDHNYAGARSKRFCKEVTPVQVVCAKRGGK